MRTLNQTEILNVTGAKMTGFETQLTWGIGGSVLGSIAGAMLCVGQATGDYAFLVNVPTAMAGSLVGIPVGFVVGIFAASVYLGLE
ncbi:MAG: hypothetical protein JSR17_10280 [Proteobacteria bacterium]|nr:hypothetical protein [Pseudomonadota bacterium]